VTATTDNTAGPKWARLPTNTFVRFGFVTASGTTVFDHAHFRIFPGKEGNFYASPPLPLSHATDDFAATGTTLWTTSFGALPGGCNCVEIQPTSTDLGYSSPAESGVSKIVEENKILQLSPQEYTEGSYGPGAGAAGTVNAQFWTECP